MNEDIYFSFVPMEFNSWEVFYTNEELAVAYSTWIPEIFRVKASDLSNDYAVEETPKVKEIG